MNRKSIELMKGIKSRETKFELLQQSGRVPNLITQ